MNAKTEKKLQKALKELRGHSLVYRNVSIIANSPLPKKKAEKFDKIVAEKKVLQFNAQQKVNRILEKM